MSFCFSRVIVTAAVPAIAGCLVTIDRSLMDAGAGGQGGSVTPRDCPTDIVSEPDVKQALPMVPVDTAYPTMGGKTTHLAAGGDLQAALNTANPGDVITLEAGASYPGPITIPNNATEGWIVVKSDAPAESLPPPGTRIDPSFAKSLPKVVAPAGATAIAAAEGAHHVRFVAVEIAPEAGTAAKTLVDIGQDESVEASLPHDIVFDRCWVHGDPKLGATNGFALDGRALAVVDSWVSDIKHPTLEAHAVLASNSRGPIRIVDNHLESTGTNVALGEHAPGVNGIVPQDIEICANHLTKLPAAELAGFKTTNLLAIQNGSRVLVSGNLFENYWAGAAVTFKRLDVVGKVPWAVVSDVTFARNLVRHVGSAVALGLGIAGKETERLVLRDNVFDDVGTASVGLDGVFVQLSGEAQDVAIDHNTSFQDGTVVLVSDDAHPRIDIRNNIAPHNDYGVKGDAHETGGNTFTELLPGGVFVANVLAGAGNLAGAYPDGNFFPASIDQVKFVDVANGNYRLSDQSQFQNKGTDGKDLGADIDALEAAVGPTK